VFGHVGFFYSPTDLRRTVMLFADFVFHPATFAALAAQL
jgi:hypothetical protein